MTDERLARTAGAGLHDTDEPAPDPRGIVMAAMARVPQVRQVHASGFRARLERETVSGWVLDDRVEVFTTEARARDASRRMTERDR